MARKKFIHMVINSLTSDVVRIAISECNRLIRDYTSQGWEVVSIFYTPRVTPHTTDFGFAVHLKKPVEVASA